MPEPDIDKLQGRDLDVLIAERLFAMPLDRQQRAADGTPLGLVEIGRYAEDDALARMVGLRLEMRHPGTRVVHESSNPARIVIHAPSGRSYTGTGDTEAAASCRAILKTLEGEGPGLDPEDIQARHDPAAGLVAVELLARKAPHHHMGFIANAMRLEQGGSPTAVDTAAKDALQWIVSTTGSIPMLENAGLRSDEDAAVASEVAAMALGELAKAGDRALLALRKIASQGQASATQAATALLKDLDG